MLNRITAVKQEEVKRLREQMKMGNIPVRQTLFNPEVLRSSGEQIRIIAEVKQASPSKGLICANFDHLKMARSYEQGGAAAVSVLTDEKFFRGDKRFIPEIKEEVSLPVLRKDFIIDELQLYETMMLGADMVLLIAAMLEYSLLLYLCEKSLELGLEPLVEIHDANELRMLKDLPIHLTNVNNRNLKDFTVDIRNSMHLAELIPDQLVKISASGIHSRTEIEQIKSWGYDAVLIGEALSGSTDPVLKLQELLAD